jgi:YggT family protein
MIYALVGIISVALTVLMWVIIGQVVLSWLLAFNVINPHSQGVRNFIAALDRILDPLYRPIRKILPDFGGLDFSPLIILLIIGILQRQILPGILMVVGPTLT